MTISPQKAAGEAQNLGGTIKAGARHSAKDQQHLNAAYAHLRDAGAVHTEPDGDDTGKAGDMDTDDMGKTLVAFGTTVKALGNGKVAGYLVRYSTPADPDLTGDFFARDTDFGDAKKSPVLYHHGLDAKIGKRKLGDAQLTIDDVGVWVEAQLNLRDEYEQEIYKLAEKGKLGWSSGTAAHLVERQPEGKSYKITSWPLGLDASLTPTPAEPRNAAMTIKSLSDYKAGWPESDGSLAGVQPTQPTQQEHPTMETGDIDIKVQAAVKAALDAKAAADKQAAEAKAALDAAREEGRKQAEAELKAQSRKGGYAYHKTATPGDGDDAQVGAFKHWLRTGDDIAARRELKEDSGLDANGQPYKTAFAEGAGANGGYTVPIPFYNQIVEKRDEVAIPMKMGATRITTALSQIGIPVENAKQGNFVIVSEAGAADENEPTFSQVAVTVYAWRRLLKVSFELLQDTTSNFDNYIASSIGRAAGLTLNNYALVGTGSSQPQGALVGGAAALTAASATTVTAAEVISLVYKLPAGYRDNAAISLAIASEGIVRGLTSNFLAFQTTPAGSANPKQPFGGQGIMGYPTFNSASMPAMTTGQKSILIGNWSYWAFVERQELVVQRANELYMANGQIGIFATWRWGGAVLQSEAFQYLTQA
jgi:HK97 family phage major capsid protein